jgi:hypothetical protein
MSMAALRRTASDQRGFFRTDQALAAGVTRRALITAQRHGEIVGIRYGLYRFSDHPPTALDALHEIGASIPTGTLSHETALELHGLSDAAPGATHVTVPVASGVKPRPGLVVHRSSLAASDRQRRSGLWVTSPARTIRDCAKAGVDPPQLQAAFRDATERGMISAEAAESIRGTYPYLELPEGLPRRRRQGQGAGRPRAVAAEESLPEWEHLLAAAARLQSILPDATLVGGTAAAIVAGHRRSLDADHVISGMVDHFDEVLADVEAAAGWRTARRQRPVVIKGSLDGILTTVRNLRRTAPLETYVVDTRSGPLRLPTPAEILRIKAWLIVDRNATRDFLDVAAISDRLGPGASAAALAPLDRLYPQEGDPGAVRQQVMRQLAMPRPVDLDLIAPRLSAYKGIDARWGRWDAVAEQAGTLVMAMVDALVANAPGWDDLGAQRPMRHRHLEGGSYDLAAIDDLLENGTLADWRPLLTRIAREPASSLAERVERLLARRDYEETGAFWRLVIDRFRAR